MEQKAARRPVRNFFVKKSMQLRLLGRIVIVAACAALITTMLIAFVYNLRAQGGTFYYMSNDVKQDIELTNILGLILPSVIVAESVSLLIGLAIGLFSSRKLAVPVYKFEKWVSQLKKGRLRTRLAFREERDMRDLTVECNAMADHYRESFSRLKELLSEMERRECVSKQCAPEIDTMRSILARFHV